PQLLPALSCSSPADLLDLLAFPTRRSSDLLAGDAGHVHSPVGGQGMNTGLQDAHHLANLLADVVHGHLEFEAVDRNEEERRPVADRKSTRLNSSHVSISYAVFCLKKKTTKH